MKIDIVSGTLPSATNLREMKTINGNDCNIVLHTNTNRLILGVRYTGGAEGVVDIFKINPSTMDLDIATDKMKIKLGAYFPQRQNRFFV